MSMSRERSAHGSALFPAGAEREFCDDRLTRMLALASQRVTEGAVTPTLDLGRFRAELADFDFLAPRRMDELLSWVITPLEHGIVHVTNPRYFGLYNPAPTFPSQCADRIAAAFNPQLATSATSPVATEIEAHVIRSVCPTRRSAAGGGGPFHQWWNRGQLHRAHLRSDPL